MKNNCDVNIKHKHVRSKFVHAYLSIILCTQFSLTVMIFKIEYTFL